MVFLLYLVHSDSFRLIDQAVDQLRNIFYDPTRFARWGLFISHNHQLALDIDV
jgi:hypothetical protein